MGSAMNVPDARCLEVGFRPLGGLLITGVPGWLTTGLLGALTRWPPQGLSFLRCLVHPAAVTQAREVLDSLGLEAEIVVGDLREPCALAAATRGVASVLHAAGVVHVRRTREWYEVNTSGTARLVAAAIQNGVERFVYISSNAAAGRAEQPGRILTEADPPHPRSHYGRSKLLAEQALLAQGDKLQAVVLRPCMFYGPPVPPRHVEVYQRIIDGRMPLVGDGRFARSLSHIDNLVEGCWLALGHPHAPGEVYYITDRPVYTTRQIIEAMARALGCPLRLLRLPRSVGPMAHAADRLLGAAGIYWQTLHLVGESDWHVGVSCEKACRELGYRPAVELDAGMKQAVEWCLARGLLRPPQKARAA